MKNIENIVQNQRGFFNTNQTLSIDFRRDILKKLKIAILEHEKDISAALKKDLNKPDMEIIVSEIGVVIKEINHMLKYIKRYSNSKNVKNDILLFPSKSFIIKRPFGLSLIIAPWNYPFQLALVPLVGAIASGNCIILKPSEISCHTSLIIEKIISKTFNENYIAVVNGGVPETNQLLEQHFDKIFFTGSTHIGKIVMEKASKHLSSVTLELGGKSPCIVDESCDLDIAIKRIIYAKSLNSGQTCIAPDYIIINETIKEMFYDKFREIAINKFNIMPENNNEFSSIINENHFDRLISYLDDGRIVFGGNYNKQKLFLELTLLEVDNLNSSVMNHEIFGPILPVITYKSKDQIFSIINKNQNPLALYIFSKNKKLIDNVMNTIDFGGGCINDALMHITNHNLPFGGKGPSGVGNYHAKYSFDAFSYDKSILKRGYKLETNMRFPPYKSSTIEFLRKHFYK